MGAARARDLHAVYIDLFIIVLRAFNATCTCEVKLKCAIVH